ncbi:uncharacterized protein LOC109614902 [Esox lucius]|uniref:uncharacterized protein LOC109614902 n=1 Tax=Esox lucius TaxID=8010 RepID=UPI0009733608|nr:uncharacterized protein LOC109614902 [Esox lucius]
MMLVTLTTVLPEWMKSVSHDPTSQTHPLIMLIFFVWIPSHLSTPAAELFSLTGACIPAPHRSVNISADRRCAFGVVHVFGTLWRQQGFFTASGKTTCYSRLVANLLDSVLLTDSISVCECQAHTNASDSVSKGYAAKAAATSPVSPILQMVSLPPTDVFSCNDFSDLQSGADTVEVSRWKRLKCLPHVAKLTHGQDHVSKGGVVNIVHNFWFAPGFSLYAENVCAKCVICMTHNVGRDTPMPTSAHSRPEGQFEHFMMDFNELTPCQGYNYCLVRVDAFYKWVEAFPCKHASAIACVIECISTSPKTDLRTHCSYHPASGGLVESANQTLKTKFTELMAETGLSWVTVMPLALMYMQGREHRTMGLSPHEVLIQWGESLFSSVV